MIDPSRVADVIGEIAETHMLPKFGKLADDDIRTKKSPSDFVTAVDDEVEKALRKALSGLLPGAGFVGEEVAAADPGVEAREMSQDVYWIVDPLDGTRNFVRSVPEFGTIVALVRGGETVMSWIYAAPQRQCAIAVKGEGADWAGEAIAPSKNVASPPLGMRSLGWLSADRRKQIGDNLKQHFQSKPSHCSAYAYIMVARGEVDFKLSSRIHPWDHAAGALLLAETGGRTAFIDDGERYAPIESIDRPLLATAPGREWDAIAKKLKQ